MGATNGFSKVFWKSVYSPKEAVEKLSVAPMWLQKTVCSSHAALEKQLNTTARGFREICENSNLLARSDVNIYN
jgi:hypothetical protein